MTDFTFYTPETAPTESKAILNNIKAGYGFIPNLFAYMAEAPVTVEAYVALNTLIGKSSLSPAHAQVALLTASLENECGFCSVAHRATGKKNGVCTQTLDALSNKTQINNPQDYAISTLTRAIVKQRGNIGESALQAFYAAGFNKQQVLEVILCVTIKTLSNYTNHLTHPEPNQELLGML